MSKNKNTIRIKSTRPVANFPYIINEYDGDNAYCIVQGLNIINYIVKEIPGISVSLDKLTLSEVKINVYWYENNGERKTGSYRIGLNPSSDGVRQGNGRCFKSTFKEFIEDLRSKHSNPDPDFNLTL